MSSGADRFRHSSESALAELEQLRALLATTSNSSSAAATKLRGVVAAKERELSCDARFGSYHLILLLPSPAGGWPRREHADQEADAELSAHTRASVAIPRTPNNQRETVNHPTLKRPTAEGYPTG